MPLGKLVTVPVPLPTLVTDSVQVLSVKMAMTYLVEVMATLQVPVPEQSAPLQPAKVEPVAGTAERLTVVLGLKLKAQVVPQSMPAGELVTDPVPVPVMVIIKA